MVTFSYRWHTGFKLRILLEHLILYILVYFWGFMNERVIFYELFCEGPSALRKYALTAVRGLRYISESDVIDSYLEQWDDV